MQELPGRAGKKTVCIEDVLFDIQGCVSPLEIARPVCLNPVTKYQILCASRRPDGIRLYEPESTDGSFESRLREEGLRDCVCAEPLEVRHRLIWVMVMLPSAAEGPTLIRDGERPPAACGGSPPHEGENKANLPLVRGRRERSERGGRSNIIVN